MSPFTKENGRWLKFAKAAELLGVSMRTVKRWIEQQETRDALLAVRHGAQWRIPYPDNLDDWRSHTRWRLKKLGVQFEPDWKRELRKIAKNENGSTVIESRRLWLAAYAKALSRGRITQKVRAGIEVLRQISCKILGDSRDSEMDLEKLKSRFPPAIRARGLSVKSIMRYWPKTQHFQRLRNAHIQADFEKIRLELDSLQGRRDERRRQRGNEPTAENLRPLCHKNILAHINDTRETLPGIVVKNPTPAELQRIIIGSIYAHMHGKKPLPSSLDFRQPQNGLKLRTFRNLHPVSPQKKSIAMVHGILDSNPCVEERLQTGKTPVRGGDY
jgi:excisionase family DNA binding protein